MSTSTSLFQAILAAMLLEVLFGLLSTRAARALKIVDYPGSAPHKQHRCPIPISGGIALVCTLLVSEVLFGTLHNESIRATFIAGLVIFIFGLWDDIKIASPVFKLIGQVLAAIILIQQGVSIRIFESPEFFLKITPTLSLYLDWILTILWIVGITNAFNFVDSMDGLAVGIGGMAAAFFMLVTLDAQQFELSLHSAIIIGACIALYFFNSPPALLFLGDSGAQTMGFILAVLAIAYVPQNANQSSSWLVPILLLGVPIFDTGLVVFSRLRRKQPIYVGARDHTYHRLLNLGFSSNRAVLLMQGVGRLLGCLAFILLHQPPLIANLVFALIVITGAVSIYILDRPNGWLKHIKLIRDLE